MIEIKEYASELWNNLSKGLDALYEKYQTLTTRADADYKEQIDALDPAYRKLKNRASVQSKIARANLDTRFSQNGLAVSGESVQRQLLQSAALQNDLTELELSKRKEQSDLENKRQNYKAQLEADASESTADYIADMTKIYQDQVNKDRQAALDREKLRIEEEHNKFEEELKQKEYELKKQQLAFEQSVKQAYSSASSSKSSKSSATSSGGTAQSGFALGIGGSKLSSSGNGTYQPKSVSAKQLVDSYAKSNPDRDRLRAKLQNVLQDQSYSKEYRYEVLVYSRAKGYV